MKISCVMPMRDCMPFVEPAVRSVLGQTGVDLELIVVEDGSSDEGPAVVERIATEDKRLNMVPGPREGIAPALNVGLAAATGELFCRCDADDAYAPPDRLARQLDFLQTHTDADAVCGIHTLTDEHDTPLTHWPMRVGGVEDITKELRAGKGRTHFCTFLVRMEMMRQLGGFRAFFNGCEDADFQLRLGDAGRVWFEPEHCYRYRLHRGGITQRQASAKRGWLEDHIRSFQRERQATGTDPLMRGEMIEVPAAFPEAEGSDSARGCANRVQAVLLGAAADHKRHGERSAAVTKAWQGVRAGPTNVRAWRTLASVALR
ncbi:MAG: glycosyltransferase family A protein [Planctomycetota bacterium]